MKFFVWCFYLLPALNGLIQAQPASTRSAPSTADGPHRFALLIGIDKYRSPDIPRLQGAKNDVMAIRGALIGHYNFSDKNVHVLTDEMATYAKIINEFDSFMIPNVTGKDDIVVIHFSGHGSRYPDPNSPSGFGETIVPYDSRDPKNLDITSKALSSMLSVLARKTRNITVILDSCNSGRMVGSRGSTTAQVRSIPEAQSPPDPPPFTTDKSRSVHPEQLQFTPLNDSYVLLAAALASEEAKEYLAGAAHYGAFSYFLTQELQRAKPDASYFDVMDPVRVRVSQRVEKQNPQLLGPNRNHTLFGTRIKEIAPYVLVVSDPAKEGKVKLPYAGEPHGVTQGSTYDVYSNDVGKFELPAKPIALIEIEEVGSSSSEAKIISGGPIVGYARARLRDLKLTDRKLAVWIQSSPQSKVLETIAARIGGFSQVELTPNRTSANILVSEDEGQVTVGTAEGTAVGIPLRSSDPDIDRKVGDQILKWTIWFYILSLDNKVAGLDVELSVTPRVAQVNSRNSKPLSQISKADTVFFNGDKVRFTLTNKSARTVYVTVLVLSSDRTISVLLPDADGKGAPVELKPGGSTSLDDVTASLPSCLSSTTDSFKVIATSNPIDSSGFFQPKGVCDEMGGREIKDLQNLFNTLNRAARGWFAGDPGAWATTQHVVQVRKRD